nr:MAG TPA: hypothetical protein [Bacteriophage sp.]
MITREQAKKNLISIGVADPTEEQITSYLNQIGSETQKEKDKADKYKEKADKADELQSKLDEIEQGNLSEIEAANKNLEKANQRIAELEKAQMVVNQKKIVTEKFKVTGEQADNIVKEDGTLDYDVLGQIIADKETAAAQAKEQEIANGSINPGGGNPGGKGEEKTNAEKIVEKLYGGESKQEKSVLSYYVD